MLYPYRASSAKNQFRWQFGVLAPRGPHEDGEPSASQTECLIEPSAPNPRLSVRVRFLRPTSASPSPGGAARPWLEGVPHDVDAVSMMSLDNLVVDRVIPLPVSGIDARMTIHTHRLGRFVALRLLLENREPWLHEFGANRDAMLEHSLVGTHLLLAVDGGAFSRRSNRRMTPPCSWPDAGTGTRGPCWSAIGPRRNLMLSSPIVLYDFPAVAEESPGDLCDAAEIDEILSLRILTMTDEEKREARATDPRARAILDRVEALTPEALAAAARHASGAPTSSIRRGRRRPTRRSSRSTSTASRRDRASGCGRTGAPTQWTCF